MNQYSIGDLARLANVSVRTLRHYDSIDLLVPSARSMAGYRLYSEIDFERLHSILFYRALGFSLKQISFVLDEEKESTLQLLAKRKSEVEEHIQRLTRLKDSIEKALQEEKDLMQKTTSFSVFDGYDPDQYAAEVEEKWGESDAYKLSQKRTKNYTSADWQSIKAESDGLTRDMAILMRAGHSETSEEALLIAEQMRVHIDRYFYPCSYEMHCQLAQMYTLDERFSQHYEKVEPNLAQYVRAAIEENARAHATE